MGESTRGVAALAVAAYVLSRDIASPAVPTRAVAGYWVLDGLDVLDVLDGLITLWASLFAATLARTASPA